MARILEVLFRWPAADFFKSWRRELLLLLGALGVVAGLEVFGRTFRSELADAAAIGVLAYCVLLCARWHQRRPFPWLHLVKNKPRQWLKRLEWLKFAWGVDFRGPPCLNGRGVHASREKRR